jgi:16S rRNA processing protein RimM
VIGTISSVNAAKREVRVDAEPKHAHELAGRERLRLRLDGVLREFRVAGMKVTEQGHIVTLSAGVTRDTVATLRGGEVVLAPDEQTARPEGHYVLDELIGYEVVGGEGTVGAVVDAFPTPANDIIEIETPEGARILAPLVEELVTTIDPVARQIHVRDLTPFAVFEDDEGAGDED